MQVNTAPGSYVRPKMSERGPLAIVEGRHPLMEQLQGSDDFVPNDTYLAGAPLTFLPLYTQRVCMHHQAVLCTTCLDLAIVGRPTHFTRPG